MRQKLFKVKKLVVFLKSLIVSPQNKAKIAFSPIHFATDFVRQMDKPDLETEFDLSNNRSIEAKKMKSEIINKICQKITNYLQN